MTDDGPIARLLDEDDDDEGLITALDRDADSDADPGSDSDERPVEPLEPESVAPEHAAFVVVGAVLTLIVIANAL